MCAARGRWSRPMSKPGLAIEELTTEDTDRHGRKKARGQDGVADDAEGRGEQAARGAGMMVGEIGPRGEKNLWAMAKLVVEGR